MPKRSLPVKFAALWVLALVIGSLLPEGAKVALGTSTAYGRTAVWQTVWTHRLVHYVAFGSTALLLAAVARKPWQRHTALLITIALGTGIETLQWFCYGSDFETRDVGDDIVAACAGYLIWHVLSSCIDKCIYTRFHLRLRRNWE